MVSHDGRPEIVAIEVRVDLCGRDTFVTQHFLHSAKIGATIHQVSGKRMSEAMWRDSFFYAGALAKILDNMKHHHAVKLFSPSIAK